MASIVIGPVTRIEGHLEIDVVAERAEAKKPRRARPPSRSPEVSLRGRDLCDRQRIPPRICGACPTDHATASSLRPVAE
jgi:Ni,Fe-hydrogenase I large subunit